MAIHYDYKVVFVPRQVNKIGHSHMGASLYLEFGSVNHCLYKLTRFTFANKKKES
jgi:hypothetical protein